MYLKSDKIPATTFLRKDVERGILYGWLWRKERGGPCEKSNSQFHVYSKDGIHVNSSSSSSSCFVSGVVICERDARGGI